MEGLFIYIRISLDEGGGRSLLKVGLTGELERGVVVEWELK